MPNTMKITVPVLYWLSPGGRNARVSVVDSEIMEYEDREAPVAVTFHDGREKLSYRVLGGRLWSKVVDGYGGRPHSTECLEPPGDGGWEAAIHTRMVLAHPLLSRYPVGSTDHIRPNMDKMDKVVPYPRTGYDLALAHVEDTLSETIVVDGGIWRPSIGPVLKMADDVAQGVLRYAHGEEYGLLAARQRAFVFDPHDAEAVTTQVSRYCPRRVQVFGNAPVVLIEDGYSRDSVSDTAVEAAAWDFSLWCEQKVRLGDLSGDGVAAMLDLRSALEATWPSDYPVPFAHLTDRTSHSHLLRHAIGRQPPARAGIAPALAKAMEHVKDIVVPLRARGWHLAVERDHAPSLELDDEALGSMTI